MLPMAFDAAPFGKGGGKGGGKGVGKGGGKGGPNFSSSASRKRPAVAMNMNFHLPLPVSDGPLPASGNLRQVLESHVAAMSQSLAAVSSLLKNQDGALDDILSPNAATTSESSALAIAKAAALRSTGAALPPPPSATLESAPNPSEVALPPPPSAAVEPALQAQASEDDEEEDASSDSLHALRDRLRAFASLREWDQFHTPRNLALALVGEVGELCECFQWRGDAGASIGLPEWEDKKRDALGEELADVLLYLVRLADKCDVDLAGAAAKKLRKNASKYPADLVRGSSKKYNEYTSTETDGAGSSTGTGKYDGAERG